MYFSIGLDKTNEVLYIVFMKQQKISFTLPRVQQKLSFKYDNEFVKFVGDQFKQLTRRHLGIPVKLYHL